MVKIYNPKTLLRTLLVILIISIGQKDAFSQQSKYLKYLTDSINEKVPVKLNLLTTDGYFVGERIAVSENGKEFYYSERTKYGPDSKSNLLRISYGKKQWSEPEILLSDSSGSPALSVDGKKMYCRYGKHLQIFQKKGQYWINPQPFDTSFKVSHYFQQTNSGKFYFAADQDNDSDKNDIYSIELKGNDTIIKRLGLNNYAKLVWDFTIARDESFIIILLDKKRNKEQHTFYGNRDLFITFKMSDGAWSKPVNMGKQINGANYKWKWGQYISNDNKTLFYSSVQKDVPYGIFWIEVEDIIVELKKRVFHQ